MRGAGVKQNTMLPQIIVTLVIKAADLTVKTNRPDIILINTAHKNKLKYAPVPVLLLRIDRGDIIESRESCIGMQ